MMRIVLMAVTLGFAVPVVAQDRVDQQGRYIPTTEEVEINARMAESLRRPTFIRLRLVFLNPTTDQTTDLAPPYKSTDRIAICIILNHYFHSPITILESLNQYSNVQLELLRNGDVVPLNKEARKQVDSALTDPPAGSSAAIQLLPGKEYELQRINLSEWYKTLLPGHYQLTVKRRFVWEGEWVQSDSITFAIGL